MVNIPDGRFQMGDMAGKGRPAERPAHTLSVRSFKLAKHEVTVGQFRSFVTATGYRTEAERNVQALPDAVVGCGVPDAGRLTYSPGLKWDAVNFPQGDRNPAVCISWNDAQQFVRWLNRETGRNFRLPSEAEWEYAARAGSQSEYIWGDSPEDGCAYANAADLTLRPEPAASDDKMNCRDGHKQTAPVGSLLPNKWGLYDVLGNAREWTEDCWSATYEGAPKDGSPWLAGDCTRRVARGSSWFGDPGNLRVGNRGSGVTPARNIDMGFRLASND